LTAHRYIEVVGLDVFYREAGDPDRPSVLLLHGFPSCSRMFRRLISRLSGRFHRVAPESPARRLRTRGGAIARLWAHGLHGNEPSPAR
jgi:pimeloyl-ACP methyl ester carboxylesterase